MTCVIVTIDDMEAQVEALLTTLATIIEDIPVNF
jgi:hypothetical protein